MVYSSLGSERAWWHCLPSLAVLTGVLLPLPACVSHPWLQGHIVPAVGAPSPASTLGLPLRGALRLPAPSTPRPMLEDKTQVLPVPTMPARLTVQVGRGVHLVGWSSLLLAPLPPTRHASPSSLWETSARTDREVPFQTLIFLPFPTIYQGQKRDGQSSSHGTVFYPSQNGVRSSPFSGPIRARWCGRT